MARLETQSVWTAIKALINGSNKSSIPTFISVQLGHNNVSMNFTYTYTYMY